MKRRILLSISNVMLVVFCTSIFVWGGNTGGFLPSVQASDDTASDLTEYKRNETFTTNYYPLDPNGKNKQNQVPSGCKATYYNFSPSSYGSPYKGALLSPINGSSPLDIWASIAESVLIANDSGVEKTDSDAVNLEDNISNGIVEDFCNDNSPYCDLDHYLKYSRPCYDKKDNEIGILTMGLNSCNSFSELYDRMINGMMELRSHYGQAAADDSGKYKKYFKWANDLHNDTTQRDIIFTGVQVIDGEEGSLLWHWDNFALAFYDFKLINIDTDSIALENGDHSEVTSANGVSDADTLASDFSYLNTLDEESQEYEDATNKIRQKLKDNVYSNYDYNNNASLQLTERTLNDTQHSITTNSRAYTRSIVETNTLNDSYSAYPTTENTKDPDAPISHKFFPKLNTKLTMSNILGMSQPWSNTVRNSVSSSDGSSVTKSDSLTLSGSTLPAHTVQYIIKDKPTDITDSNIHEVSKLYFNHPVAVTYKVAVIQMSGGAYIDNCAIADIDGYMHSSFIAKFGEGTSENDECDAITSLSERLYTYEDQNYKGSKPDYDSRSGATYSYFNPESSDKEYEKLVDFNWDNENLKAAARSLSFNYPVYNERTFVNMDARSNELTSNLSAKIFPMYKLDKVVLSPGEDNTSKATLTLTSENSQYPLKNIQLTGIDAGPNKSSKYYGFDQNNGGEWKLCDEKGNDIPESEFIELYSPEGEGQQIKIKDGAPNGTAYIKYVIYDGLYTSEEQAIDSKNGKYEFKNDIQYTNDSELSERPIITVNVSDETTNISQSSNKKLTVHGQAYFQTNTEFDLNSSDCENCQLNKFIESDNNKPEIIPSCDWEVQETDGISINGNIVTASSPGKYHVRALYNGLTSDWVEIEAVGYDPQIIEKTTPDNTISPQPTSNEVTQDEACSSVYDLCKQLNLSEEKKENIRKEVKWLLDNDIIKKKDEWKSDDIITREQFVNMLYNLAKYEGKDISANDCISSCSDVADVSEQYYDSVNWAVSKGILLIDENNNINPKKGLQRQELQSSLKQYILENKDLYVEGKVSWWQSIVNFFKSFF